MISVLNNKQVEAFLKATNEKRRIFIIGASGSGKSTIWHEIYSLKLKNTSLPVRYISRPLRLDDDIIENKNIELDNFEYLFRAKVLEFYWAKYLPEKTELYGFPYCPDDVVIYGCNNEFIFNSASLILQSDIFINSVKVLVTCSEDERLRRLLNRYTNSNVTKSEYQYRVEIIDKETEIKNKSDLLFINEGDIKSNVNELLNLLSLNSM